MGPTGQLLTFLYTDDLKAMTAFYRDVMRLRPVIDQGAAVIFQVNEGAYLGVCDLPHRPRGTKGVMVTFVREVDAEYERLKAAGVEFEGPPSLLMDGTVYAAFFRDPEGYHLEIQEFRNPDWDRLFQGAEA